MVTRTPETSDAFRDVLKHFRSRKHWSQERAATEAEMDHSLVSRLESGQRSPTREAIGKLASGLQLSRAEHDALLIHAGYLPIDTASLLHDEPELCQLLRILRNGAVTETRKHDIRRTIGSLASALS